MKNIIQKANPEDNLSKNSLISKIESINNVKELEDYKDAIDRRYKSSLSVSEQIEINLAYIDQVVKLESQSKDTALKLRADSRLIKLHLLKLTATERAEYVKQNSLYKYKSRLLAETVNFAQEAEEILSGIDLPSVAELREISNQRLFNALDELLKSSPNENNNPAYEPEAPDVINVELKQRYCLAIIQNAMASSEDERAAIISMISNQNAFNNQPEYDAIIAILTMPEKFSELARLAQQMAVGMQKLTDTNDDREGFIKACNDELIPVAAELFTVWSSEIAYIFSPAFMQSIAMDSKRMVDRIALQLKQKPYFVELPAAQIQFIFDIANNAAAPIDEELRVECYGKILDIFAKGLFNQIIKIQNEKIGKIAEYLYKTRIFNEEMFKNVFTDINQLLYIAGTIEDKKILDGIFKLVLELHKNIQDSLFNHFGSREETFKVFMHSQDFIFTQTADLITPRLIEVDKVRKQMYEDFEDRELRDAHPELYLKLYIKIIDYVKSLVSQKRIMPKNIADDSIPHLSELDDLRHTMAMQLRTAVGTSDHLKKNQPKFHM